MKILYSNFWPDYALFDFKLDQWTFLPRVSFTATAEAISYNLASWPILYLHPWDRSEAGVDILGKAFWREHNWLPDCLLYKLPTGIAQVKIYLSTLLAPNLLASTWSFCLMAFKGKTLFLSFTFSCERHCDYISRLNPCMHSVAGSCTCYFPVWTLSFVTEMLKRLSSRMVCSESTFKDVIPVIV